LIISSVSLAQTTFHRAYFSGSAASSAANCVEQTADGGYIILAEQITVSSFSPSLLKIGPSGDTLWSKTYNGLSMGKMLSVVPANDGGYLLAGYTGDTSGYKGLVIKTGNNGDTLWTRSIGYGTGLDFLYSAMQTSSGDYLLCGSSGGIGGSDIYVARMSSSGALAWSNVYGTGSNETAISMIETGNGYVICGTNGVSLIFLSIDQLGAVVQSHQIVLPYFIWSCDMEKVSNGYVFTGTFMLQSGAAASFAIMTDQSFNVTWSYIYKIVSAYALDACVNTSGEITVCGATSDSSTYNILVFQLDPNGAVNWGRSYRSAGFYSRGASIKNTADQGYIITGYTTVPSYVVCALKTDSLGNAFCDQTHVTVMDSSITATLSPISVLTAAGPSAGFLQLQVSTGTSFSNVCPVGIPEPSRDPLPSVHVFPNPFSSSAIFELSGITLPAVVSLYNSLGQKVQENQIADSRFAISKNDLPPGVYFYSIRPVGEMILTGKLIIE
jgi:hypothetical protein